MNLARVLENHKQWMANGSGEKANLSYAYLRSADLRSADLSYADLSSANLRYADLSYADLSSANLSGTQGLLSPIDWMAKNLERTENGYIAYKSFNSQY